MGMNVLITGGGGREHALAWALHEHDSVRISNLYVAPGNPGTAGMAENIAIPTTDPDAAVAFAVQNDVDFVIVGPDNQLADGIIDRCTHAGILSFGPTRHAAKIEWSKQLAKEIMTEMGIPTAGYQAFDDPASAMAYVAKDGLIFPQFIKADGLALGKGAIKVHDAAEARNVVHDLMNEHKLGAAGNRIVIEACLDGMELSLHALTDGTHYMLFPPAQDHKTIGENHTGPMTGGMGTIAPVPGISEETYNRYGELVVAPLLEGLRQRGISYTGMLFPGLMLVDKQPYVLEYNSRFGDPETQSYMRLVKDGLFDALLRCPVGSLDHASLQWRNAAAVCVVLASAGYPVSSQTGVVIEGIDAANTLPGVRVFHAGTAVDDSGHLVTNGGRVLDVTAIGNTLEEARLRAYDAVAQIHFPGMQVRNDIGKQALEHAKTHRE